jgi:hypothetical protein
LRSLPPVAARDGEFEQEGNVLEGLREALKEVRKKERKEGGKGRKGRQEKSKKGE